MGGDREIEISKIKKKFKNKNFEKM